MTITIIQQVTKTDINQDVIIPLKDLKALGVDVGNEVEVTVSKVDGNSNYSVLS